MMDRVSSEQEILQEILNMEFKESNEIMQEDLLHLLSKIDIYDFDLKSAIIHFLQN